MSENLLLDMVLSLDGTSGLLNQDKVYIHPNIPAKKLQNAINSYANNVKSENVMVLFDDTAFGGAKDGLIFTKDGLFTKQSFEKPIFVKLDNIRKISGGGLLKSVLNVNESKIVSFDIISKGAVNGLCKLVESYIEKLNDKNNLTKNKDAPSHVDNITVTSNSANNFNEEILNKENLLLSMILSLDGTHSLVTQDNLYVHPNIPAKKIRNALESYVHNTKPEDIIVLLDDTLFGSGSDGVALTKEGIFIKPNNSRNKYFFDIDCIKTIAADGIVLINLVINGSEKLPDFNQIGKSSLRAFCEFVNLYLSKLRQIESNIQAESENVITQVASSNHQYKVEKINEDSEEQGHIEAKSLLKSIQPINPDQDVFKLGVRERLRLSKSKKLPEEIQLALQADRYSCISESLLSNSKFSVDYQNRLLEQDKDILLHFAINPYLSESTQMQLAENYDIDVRSRIASNNNICDKVQTKLARDSERSVLSVLAQNPSLATNLIDSLLNTQKYALAMNPNLPTKFLHQLVQSEDTMVKGCLAGNPLIFKENNLEIAKILMHDKWQNVKAALFDNENTYFIEKIVDELETLSDSKLIEGLSNGTDFYRACIAKSNISQNIQSKLMLDKVDYVKSILASNPVISEKTQLKLAMDDEISVLVNLAKNPSITDSVQDKLIKKDFERVLYRLAMNQNLSDSNYAKLYNNGNKKIRKYLAQNINLPEDFQLKLSDHSVHDVLINLAGNPNLTEEIQLKLVDKDDMEISNNLIMNSALHDSVELKLG